jgi:hypothetical protein
LALLYSEDSLLNNFRQRKVPVANSLARIGTGHRGTLRSSLGRLHNEKHMENAATLMNDLGDLKAIAPLLVCFVLKLIKVELLYD